MHQNTDTTQQKSQPAMLTRSSQRVSRKLDKSAVSSFSIPVEFADLPQNATSRVLFEYCEIQTAKNWSRHASTVVIIMSYE